MKPNIMHRRHVLRSCFLVVLLSVWGISRVFAVNAPTITHIQGKPVVPGVTQFVNVITGLIIRGNAEAGTTIRLFRAGSLSGTGTTDGAGVWSITFNTSEGKYDFDADANDGTFTSARCPAVNIHLDIQPPYGYLCNSWNTFVGSSYYSTSYYYHTIYETGGTSGSGVDFSTASQTIIDRTTGTVINSILTSDNINRVNFAPQPNDTNIKIDGHEYWYGFQIADKAGNVWTASKTFFCDKTAPVTTVQKIYDPLHSTVTGIGEPNPNPPDANGFVNYYQNMTIATQPIRVRGMTSAPCNYQEGSGTYYISMSNAPTSYLSNGYIDSTGSFTTPINSKFYSGSVSFGVRTYDSANNNQYFTFSLTFVNPCPDPVIKKVRDPNHHLFTGTGETAANLPDAGGWVNYFPNMTISSAPTALIGTIDPTNMSYFRLNHSLMGNVYKYVGTQIDPVTGSFTVELNADFWNGTHTFTWYIYNDSGGNQTRSTNLIFADGHPAPPNSISSINYSQWEYYKIPTDNRIIPNFTGSASVYAFPQTIWLKGNGGTAAFNAAFQYCTVVLPSGQTYPNVSGAYDLGDVWQDSNQNGQWDTGEAYKDMPARGVSDGRSFAIHNFLNLEGWDNMSYTYLYYAYARNPYYLSSIYYGTYWFSQWAYAHEVQEVNVLPAQATPYRQTAQKPTSLDITCYKPTGSYSPSNVYGLKPTQSTVSLKNNLDQIYLAPTANWTYQGNPDRYRSVISVAATAFPEATYRIPIHLINEMNVVTDVASHFFLIDNTAPMAQNFMPAEGAVSNSFTSFNAKIVDPYLLDNSPGAGANLDVALPQIWPFRLLTNQYPLANTNTDILTFTLADGETFAKSHQGTILTAGTQLEVWKVLSGQYQNATIAVSILANPGNGTLQVETVSGSNFPKNTDYVVMFSIPSFTSNNGLDRVGAVPISPVQEDAQYVCRVLTLDKAGNAGAFFAPYSRLELAAGPITLTTDRTFLFMGLVPPDGASFTSSTILTRKGNIVQDNQAVTVQRSPDDLTQFTLPDANGLPGDGYQVYTGTNGATPGEGRFVYGIGVTGTSSGILNSIAAIGLASGSAAAIPIVQIEAFSLVPATTTPAITPTNPTGATSVGCSQIGYSGTSVPNGSLATWTVTAHSVSNPTGSMITITGYHPSYINPAALVDDNEGTYGLYFYNPSWSAPLPGSLIQIDLGAGNAREWVRVDGRTYDTGLNVEYDIQWSDNGTAWTTVVTKYKPSGSGWTRADWPYPGAHRFWRLFQTNTPTYYYHLLYELRWFENPARPNVTPDMSPLPGIQATIQSGSSTVFVTAEKKGGVTFGMEVGGRTASCLITFLDRYPPDPPASMTVSPQYSQGSTQITWADAVDYAGAGTKDYFVQQSLNGGPFASSTAIVATQTLISGLADGDYLFRITARDNDGNIGNPGPATFCMVDTVPPPAVACSDLSGNTDPDELFSVDPNVLFSFSPTDNHSGVGEVNVQVATAADFSAIVEDVWIPADTQYLFTNGVSGNIYYARVRSKDRCGNIGAVGSSSNGITVHFTGATTPPNAPIISAIDGKPAIPGTPVSTNKTTGLTVAGMSESSNLVEVWIDNAYVRSVIAGADGTYLHSVALAAGEHLVKTRSHNGFAMSPFSTEFRIIIDTTPPTLDLRIYMTGNWLVDRNWVSRAGNQHNIEYINLVVADTGGSGFDINLASITVADIDDTGTFLPATASYPNPVAGAMSVLAADTNRFIPSPSWAACLQDQHRYRIFFEAFDNAGNRGYLTRDIAIDSIRPGSAAPVPPTTSPASSAFRELFVYNLASFPTGLPPATACAPLVWSAGDNAFVVDPAFNDPTIVDNSTSPVALLFNTPGIYGHVWAASAYNPPPQTNLDTYAYSTGIAWGWGSNITLAANALGHTNWFRYGYRTIVNGIHVCTFYIQDSAICRDLPNMKLNIQSPTPAPRPPLSARFYDATNPAQEFPTIVWTDLFAIPGNWMYAMDTVITNHSNPLMIKVQVPLETFDQTVEAFKGATIYASATIPAGSDMAVLLMELTGATWKRDFQLRTRANGFLSMNLPRESVGWYYAYVRDDVTAPLAYDLIPTERNYNSLAGASAKPFPTRFSVRAKDTTNGTNISWIKIPASTARLQNAAETAVTGTLTKEYDPPATLYGFRYDLTAAPTVEGTYYYRVQLDDGAQPTANAFVASYPFRLDKTPPAPADVSPGDGTITNSLPSFSCQSQDPALADGTEGSGPNMDPTLAQVEPFKDLGHRTPIDGSTIEVTISGIDTTATNHVDSPLTVGTTVALAKVNGTTIDRPLRFGTITSNGGDLLRATLTSGPALVLTDTYAVLWAIPCFQSNDGIDRLAAVPISPAVKGGAYVAYFTLTDKSLNQGTYTSASSIYEAAYGPFTLTPDRISLYAGLIPPHAANYVSGAILTTEGNPVQPGTKVTVFTQPQLGGFAPADANGVPGDGHQVNCDASGILHFQLLASGTGLGTAKVKAVLGLANGSDSSVVFVPLPTYAATVTQTILTITPGDLTPTTAITAGTFGVSGDLVPNGTMLNATTTLGWFLPADAIATYAGHQIAITAGAAAFTFKADSAGTANLTFECGGRIVTKTITVIDQAPPTAPGIPDISPVLSGTGNLLVTWGAATDPGNSGIAGYELESSFNGGAWTTLASVALPIYNTTNLPHGKYSFRARARDGAGNVGAYGGGSVQAEVDRVPPSGSITVNGGDTRTATTAVILSLTATDTNGVSGMSFSNDGTTWTSWRAMAATSAWDLAPIDGSKIVYARFQDSLGNISVPQQKGIILDTTGPLGSVVLTPTPFSSTHTISLSLNAVDGAGIAWMSLQNEGQSPMTTTYSSLLSWNLAPGQGTHSVTVSFVDTLGNRSASSTVSTIVDSVKPTTPAVFDDGTFSPFIDRLHATWNATDSESGLDHYLVRVGTSAGAANVASDTDVGLATENTFASLTLDLSGATLYYFTVWAYDRAGGVSLPGYSDGVKGGDPTPPLPVTVTDDGAYSASATILHATWNSSSDPDSGINRYEFSAGTTAGNPNVVPWTTVGFSTSYTATGLSLTPGSTYWINIRIFNNGGTSTTCLSDGITIDTAPPPLPTMAAEPAYTSGTVNLVQCNAVTDGLSGGVEYLFQRATNSGFTAGVILSPWTGNPWYEFGGLAHDTTYYFRVCARDAVGNTTASSTAVSSWQDGNPPTAASYTDHVAANNDTDQSWTSNTDVSFEAVNLTDDRSGVKDVFVEIASETGFASPVWSGWLGNTTGATTKTVGVPDGTMVYARARFEDTAGNLSGWLVTDGIRVDLTDPAAGATTDAVAGNNDPDHKVSVDASLYFAFTPSDTPPGEVADIRIQIASDAGFTQIATDVSLGAAATAYHFSNAADGSTYTARILVQDRAGRFSPWSTPSDGIFVDMSAPGTTASSPFFINAREVSPGVFLGDGTTATTAVRLTITVTDISGVAQAEVSNDGISWTTWTYPPYGASIPWTIPAIAGTSTIYMSFMDPWGNTTPVSSQTISYYPAFSVQPGTRDDRIYPVDTYDEYAGQNKYGTDRSASSTAATGRSFPLKKP